MTSLDHLLPEPDEAVRCADHARRLAVDPGGSAIRADRVVLIETPLPWPKPVFAHPLLSDINPVIKGSAVPTRTLATVPPEGRPEGWPVEVTMLDRLAQGRVMERRFTPGSPAELMAVAEAAAADDHAALDRLSVERGELTRPVVLVCTQGSHDVCCGSEGTRFATEAEAIDGVQVHRVSHTGGHRFAPTAMTLPDGRMWADLDVDLLRRIVNRLGPVDDELIARCRGWWGAETGGAQMAERAVFAELGWECENADRSVKGEGSVDGAVGPSAAIGGSMVTDQRFIVLAGDLQLEVVVGVAREIPTIACREPGGLPAKPSIEYEIRRLEAVRDR